MVIAHGEERVPTGEWGPRTGSSASLFKGGTILGRSKLVALMALSIVVGTLVPLPAPAQATHLQQPGTVEIIVTDAGPSPRVAYAGPGQTVTWSNESSGPSSIVERSGLFDSGAVPSGGAFSATLTAIGAYEYTDPAAGYRGVVYIGLSGIDADPAALAAASIPDIPFADEFESDVDLHPDVGMFTSRTRIITAFDDSATVSEVNAAIQAAGASIVGGLPDLGIVLLVIPPADDFSTLDTALATLRSYPAIAVASMDIQVEANVTPPNDGSQSNYAWTNTRTSTSPFGRGGNWHLEASRFPQAWNLTEAARLEQGSGTSLPVLTLVVDGRFNPAHEDLDVLIPGASLPDGSTVPELCLGGLADRDRCIGNPPDDPAEPKTHGTHVAGIVAAAHSSPGVAGANPVAGAVIGVPLLGNNVRATADSPAKHVGGAALWDAILRYADSYRTNGLGRIRVINYSIGHSGESAEKFLDNWKDTKYGHGIFECGPGVNDDGLVGSNEFCSWSTLDSIQKERAASGEIGRRIAKGFEQRGILIVAAAGNESTGPDAFCVSAAEGAFADMVRDAADTEFIDNPLKPADCLPVRQDSKYASQFTYSGATWKDSDGSNPIIVVESLARSTNTTLDLSSFSNNGGTVSAPGSSILSTCTAPSGYCVKSGTSMASPVVTGLIGYLFAIKPDLTIAQVRKAILGWALPLAVPSDPTQPRIDAFSSVLSLPGSAKALVDVNDGSIDGNRRVILGSGGNIVGSDDQFSDLDGFFTQPDGVVDMRDFRRFRDAWLQDCLLTLGLPSCPAESDIDLNGDSLAHGSVANHPKRDLNLDGCVYLGITGATADPNNCKTPEWLFNRFDFNGDGVIGVTAGFLMLVPLLADGTVAPDAASAVSLTDLGVIKSQWDEPGQDEEGWRANDLANLMYSGDLEIHGRALFDAGATSVVLDVQNMSDPANPTTVTTRTLSADLSLPAEEDFSVVTVPSGTAMRVLFRAMVGGVEETVPIDLDPLLSGEDRRIDACGSVQVVVDPFSLRPDGTSQALVTATVDPCLVDALDVPVGFTIDPSGGSHATVSPLEPLTDADGVATGLVTAGTETARYTITAHAVPQAGAALTGTTTLIVNGNYSYSVLVESGDGQPFSTLGMAPSLRGDGDVAFTAIATSTNVDDVYTWNPGTVDNISDGVFSALDAQDAPVVLGDPILLTDSGQIFVRLERTEGTGIGLQTRSWVYRLDEATPGTATMVVKGHLCECIEDSDAEYEEVGHAAADNSGGVIIPVDLLDDASTSVSLAAPVDGGPTVIGPAVDLGTTDVRPVRADDGTTVIFSPLQQGVFVGLGVLGTPSQLQASQLASSLVWTELGTQPAISEDGAVVALLGDRGGGPAAFISYRTPGGFTAPERVAGEHLLGPRPELGTNSQGQSLYLSDISLDTRVGVSHLELGAPGLEGDSAVLVFEGTPVAAGEGFTDQTGLWSVIVDFVPSGNPDFPLLVPRQPAPIAQIGDVLGGVPIDALGFYDGVANADGQSGGPEAGDHRVAYWQSVGARQQIIRATWVGGTGSGAQSIQSVTEESTTSPGTTRKKRTSTSLSSATTTYSTTSTTSSSVTVSATTTASAVPAASGVITAIAVSSVSPVVGEVVTITNRSRDTGGVPVLATVDFGDGSSPLLVPPDASIGHSYSADGPFRPTMTATDATGDALAAAVDLVVFADAGAANTAPIADAGGPYLVTVGTGVTLNGLGSSDGDAGDLIVEYSWDLDGDTGFGDRTGSLPKLSWPDTEALICGGSCTPDLAYPIALRVTDSFGEPATAGTTLTVEVGPQDFTISVDPVSQPINPGGVASFLVSVGSVGGFADPVTLSAPGLPLGWAASFAPEVVTPAGEATVFITSPQNLLEGSVDLVVRGTSGDIAHDSTGTANVGFGLIPQCFGSVAGLVTDAGTGVPLAGVRITARAPNSPFAIATTLTGADGRYLFADLLAGARINLEATGAAGYWRNTVGSFLIVCDATRQDADIDLTPIRYGSIEGRVVDRDTSQPIESASVSGGVETDATGFYVSGPVGLRSGNLPNTIQWTAVAAGFWPQTHTVTVDVDGPEIVDFDLLRQCTATVGGGVVRDESGVPVPGSRVILSATPAGAGAVVEATTDAAGVFRFDTAVLLGFENSEVTAGVTAFPPDGAPVGSDSNSLGFLITQCDQLVDGLELTLFPPLGQHFGTVQGTVTAADTGLPVDNVPVRLLLNGAPLGVFRSALTDEYGRYVIEEVFLGEGTTASRNFTASGGGQPTAVLDYWPDVSDLFTLESGQTVTRDLVLQPIDRAAVIGTIRDRYTGLPIEGARIDVGQFGGGTAFSDPDGGFFVDRVLPGTGNTDRVVGVGAFKSGYWGLSLPDSILIQPGQTSTIDLSLIPVCDGATIRGIVLDASSGDPLANAFVFVPNFASVLTDTNGFFELVGVPVGTDNTARTVNVTAQKSGFTPQTKSVTVSCGAMISLDFGQPDGGFGVIAGTVTASGSGQPIPGVLIGTEFGKTDTTGADGTYRIIGAPLASDGGPRSWSVTAFHPGGDEADALVTVSSVGDAVQDFEFVLAPDLTLLKGDGLSSIVVGESIHYVLSVSNLGSGPAPGVTLTDVLPPGTNFSSATPTQGSCTETGGTVTCDLGEITAGATAGATIVVDTLTIGVATNTATVTTSGDPDPANNSASDDTNVHPIPDLSVVKSDGLASAFVGDELTYVATVTNSGQSDLRDVVAIDTLPEGVEYLYADADLTGANCAQAGQAVRCVLREIPAGGSVEITIVVRALTVGTMTNTITVGSDTADSDEANNVASDTTEILPASARAADLAVTKTDDVDGVDVGDAITYTVTVSNLGPDTAENVELIDTLPAEALYVSSSSTRGNCTEDTGIVTCALGDLGAAMGVEVSIVVSTGTTGVLVNSAVAGSETQDPDAANNVAIESTVVRPTGADLTIEKTDGRDWVLLGEPFTWVVTVSNAGPQDAQNVVLTEALPASVFIIDAFWTQGDCFPDGPNDVTCLLGTIPVGQTVEVFLTVIPEETGTATNVATVSSATEDPNTANNTASDSTDIVTEPRVEADLSVTKTDGVDSVVEGGALSYTIVVSNAGPSNAQSVTVTDPLPAGTTFVAAGADQGSCIEAAGAVNCDIGDIAPDGSATVTIDVTTGVQGTISNTVTVASETPDPVSTNNSATDATTTTPDPSAAVDLAISKSAGNTSPLPGATIIYTLAYANNGDRDSSGVVVTESVPADTAFLTNQSTPGWSCAPDAAAGSTCTYAVGSVPAGGTGFLFFGVALGGEVAAGTEIPNTASIADDGAGGPDANDADNQSTATVVVTTVPDLSLANDDGGVTVTPGGTVAYALTYENVGDSAASDIWLIETIPAHTVFSVGESSAGWLCDATTCIMLLGPLSPGDSGTVMFAVAVTQSVPSDVVQIENAATIFDAAGGGVDANPADNSAADVTPIELIDLIPVISLLGPDPLTLELGDPFVDPGAEVTDDVDPTIVITGESTVDRNNVGPYSVTYNHTDSGGNQALPVVRVVNVVDTTAPVVSLTTPPEGVAYGLGAVVLADFACTDLDLDTCVGDVADGAAIDTSTLGPHTFTVTGADKSDNATSVTHNYSVFSPNTAPTITSDGGGSLSAVSVAENQTAVTDVQTTDDNDSEGAGLTYSLTGGADQALFTIDASIGVLSFLAAPDFEAPTDAGGDNGYEVQVTVTDSGSLTDMQYLVVTVEDVVEGGDTQGPITSQIQPTPDLAVIGTDVALTALIDDTATGGSTIAAAEYSINHGAYGPLAASDGAFDEVSERVGATVPAASFSVPGIYEICVRGTDSAGNLGDASCIAVAVYDPYGGSVTGGGWIESSPGAYAADPGAVGFAYFGFVSAYKKARPVPDGQTQFRLTAGDLNFHSLSYELLVVDQGNSRAQFSGTGTVNGAGEYRFKIWVTDGDLKGTGADTFRIRIWLEDLDGTEHVIYDSGSDQAIALGDVTIHEPKGKKAEVTPGHLPLAVQFMRAGSIASVYLS